MRPLALALILTACESDPGTTRDPREVAFDVGCDLVLCENQNDRSTFTSGDTQSVSCIWYCHEYQGQADSYVDLTWTRSGNDCFALQSEYVSDGICD